MTSTPDGSAPGSRPGTDFIRQIIARDLARGLHDGRVVTRFPPEPNGYLHIGHAKSIVLNFGIAGEHERGRCHLRFDDTNPITENVRFVESIQEDVRWLGYDWGEHLYFASDYFEEMYACAVELIEKGLAYVDSQTEEEIREGRGTVTVPGTPSPHRDRPVAENLDLFRRMRAGEFPEGAHVLRARIDMAAPNMLMRDPVLYRIRHAHHYRTGDAWCIYPLYDFAHPLEDALEGITHSICTLEFENNREFYDWLVENVSIPHRPRQYEFARLNLDYTIMSKRKLLRLVEEGRVEGWDDPRLPTLAGLRRRGYTPSAIRAFCEMIGVAKADARVDMAKLEYAIRDDLNRKAPRVLAVPRPLKVTLTNWPEGRVEELDAPFYPRDVGLEGSRRLPFSGELFIDRDDFSDDPPPGYRRLVPGGEVRLRYAYVIRCDEVVRNEAGEVVELRCSHDPETRSGSAPSGRKVKGTIQWVSAAHAVPCRLRTYDRLFSVPDPDAAASHAGVDAGTPSAPAAGIHGDFRDFLNPESLEVLEDALIEPSVVGDAADTRYQFERVGYFWRDPVDSTPEALVFNRIVTLRDTWARRREAAEAPPASPKTSGVKPGAGESGPTTPSRKTGATGPRPELPPEARARADELERSHGIGRVDAEILARDSAVEAFYRAAVSAYPGRPRKDRPAGSISVANWVINELPPVLGDRNPADLPFDAAALGRLVGLVDDDTLNSSGGREVLEVMAREGGDPAAIVEARDLSQMRDPDKLEGVALGVLEAHPGKVKAYLSGKRGLEGFFMGQIMRETRGKADPELARGILRKMLGTHDSGEAGD
ncbi:MAG: glutamine--tRNA ligase/YqeY domain fusion protein [Gemmatimonadales bacterium]|nr:MAG: glutamine--tRNA ligase/YqeY domain fusion protein [Gemmatimonadales bacterium]